MKRKVYFLSSPEDLVPRYVGCTKRSLKQRLHDHIKDYNAQKNPRCFWITSLREKHIKPLITLIAEVEDWEDWEEREQHYIALFREKYPLVNSTDGGVKVFANGVSLAAKRVQCIETGEVFNCGREAAKYLGMSIRSVTASITRGVRCGGFTWKYVDEDGEESNTKGELRRNRERRDRSSGGNPKARRVICVETGEIFPCGVDACNHLGMSDSAVRCAIKRGKVCGGFHWKFVDGELPEKRRVQCVETGEVFRSVKEAAKYLGLARSSVQNALDKGHRSGGLHWKYADDEPHCEGVPT